MEEKELNPSAINSSKVVDKGEGLNGFVGGEFCAESLGVVVEEKAD